jgi:hypothetical protein
MGREIVELTFSNVDAERLLITSVVSLAFGVCLSSCLDNTKEA